MKWILLLVVAGLGCGGQPAEQPQVVDLEAVSPQGQQLVFWYQHNREREAELLALIEEFNQTNAYGIRVKGEYAGRYDDIYNKMIVALQGGTLPNLLVAYQNQAQMSYRSGGTVDLKLFMDSPKWGLSAADKADFYAAFLDQDNADGVQISFPPNRSMEIFYYNVDWLAELGYDGPPRTWIQFAEMCRKAKAQPFSRAPENSQRSLGFLLEPDASRLASMVFSRGGDFMNSAGTAYTFKTPQVEAALTQMQQLIDEGAAGVVSEDYEDQSEFAVGRVLFALRSSSGLPFFEAAVQSGEGFNWNVGSPPYEGGKPAVNVYGASLAVGRTAPEQQLASWLFIKWFTQPEQQARWVKASNYFPVRRSTAAQLGDYFVQNPRYKRAFELLEYGMSEPAVAGYEPVRRLIAQTMVRAVGGQAVEPLLTRLEREANASLE